MMDVLRTAAAALAVPVGPTYASLGTIIHEQGGGGVLQTIPYDSGVGQTLAAGTIGVLARYDSVATSTFLAGNGATFTTNPGVGMLNLTTGALRGRIAGDAFVQPAVAGIVTGTWQACILCWDASTLLVRLDGTEASSAHTTTNYTSAGRNIYIGTSDNDSAVHSGAVIKAVIYTSFLNATNRASLVSLLAGEAP